MNGINGSRKLVFSVLAGLIIIAASSAVGVLWSSVDRSVVDDLATKITAKLDKITVEVGGVRTKVTANSEKCLENNSTQSARLGVVENNFTFLSPAIASLSDELKKTRDDLQELKIEIVKLQEQIKNR